MVDQRGFHVIEEDLDEDDWVIDAHEENVKDLEEDLRVSAEMDKYER